MYLKTLHSLRGRYALTTGLMASIVLFGALVGYQQLETARQSTTENIGARNLVLERSRMVRDAVWTTRESLASFLLEPNIVEQRGAIQRSLTNAQVQTEMLLGHPWIKQNHYLHDIQTLKQTLQSLEVAINELIQTRLDVPRQYPALALARARMSPNHDVFYSAADLAIAEILDDPVTFRNQQVYQLFVQARHLWTQMISNFRIYLANRLGSFDESTLAAQEQTVITHYNSLQRLLEQLKKFDSTTQLELQGSISLGDFLSASDAWFRAFLDIKTIHNSDEWRADAKLIRTTINPRMDAIWRTLINLDKDIENSANNDVSTITNVAENQTRTLWLFTTLCLGLIIAGYYALERMILRPVASIAQALKTESQNIQGTDLNCSIRETRDLVDAFITMRKQVQARQTALEYHALHDSLTNLGNRYRLTSNLEQAIKTAARENRSLALLVLDLDRFKEVNDTLGHPTGDQLLIEVGLRLSGLLRDADTIARLGGDEFAILLPTANETHAIKIAEKISTALSAPFNLDKRQLYTSASIGITVYPQHGMDARSLIQHADIAMYQAKHSKSILALYDSEKDQNSLERLGLMADLRKALKNDGLDVYYQPQVNLTENKTIGMEALLRWEHPEYGFVPPEKIITLAEQTGLIHDIAFWVLKRAVTQARQWMDAGVVLNVAVNLSAHNLEDDRLISQVKDVLAHTQFPAKHLTLEITENAMMTNPERAVGTLTQLNAMGIQLSVDDFGTGFSSLGYLKRLPVSELKIDKSFVAEMSENENDAVIVRSTIELAHNLGLKVVAEGVADQETWNLLQILGCDTAQGFFISTPVSAVKFEDWLGLRPARPAGQRPQPRLVVA